jgi:hypothetical protein
MELYISSLINLNVERAEKSHLVGKCRLSLVERGKIRPKPNVVLRLRGRILATIRG